jgi:4-amino-4-deoxy-L-arabinose transferase-like glycosyltransferase
METGIRETSQQTYRRLFWLLVFASTLFRMAIAGRFGLGTDEAHYVLFSRHLAWGYFDHPPMVAFLAALTTLFGEGTFFVRLGPIICSAISLAVLRSLAIVLYRDERVAFWAAVMILLMPSTC